MSAKEDFLVAEKREILKVVALIEGILPREYLDSHETHFDGG
jgi:hypothetical protein